MEMLSAKLTVITNSIKKKPYDFLDQRKTDFDGDYEDFKRNIQDLHVICVVLHIIGYVLWLACTTNWKIEASINFLRPLSEIV